MRALSSLWFVGLSGLAACGTEYVQVPPTVVDGGGQPPDAGVVITPDGGVVDPNGKVQISGRVLRLDSYLEGVEIAVPQASVRALGATDVDPVAADAVGAYALTVPPNGLLLLAANRPGYWQTYEQVTVGAQNAVRNFYLAYEPHIQLMATRFGVDIETPFPCHAPNNGNCKYAIVMGRVVDDGSYDNGTPTPMGDIQANEFVFKAGNNANWYKRGPYFFFYTGQPDPAATATKRYRGVATNDKYRGGLFVYFVEMPVGSNDPVDVEVAAASNAGGAERRYFGPYSVKAFREGFSWLTLRESAQPLPPPENPPPPPPVDADFATQVYPLFAQVAEGGLGCQGCHTNQGGAVPSGGLNLYGGPDAAYAALNPQTYPQRVNVQNPGQSYLLRRPLYEADGNQDHPIYAFNSEQDPGYRIIYGWIQGGAIYEGGNNPPPPEVSFYNDVRPLLYRPVAEGGAGCYNCHVNGVNAQNAPGGAYFGGNGNDLFQVLTAQAPVSPGLYNEAYRINKQGQVGRSLILTKPLIGGAEPHPAKIFNGADDPRYQTIYRWISEGYTNDTP